MPATWLLDVSRERQKQILDLEDTLRSSRWAIAQSRRLIEKTSELRALFDAPRASRPASGDEQQP